MTDGKRLVLLHATDVHSSLERIEQLKQWLKEEDSKIDLVLLSGDLANMAMDPNAPQAEVEKSHRALDEVAQSFLSISSKVYYIPGNHDAITTFKTEGQSTATPCNVHTRSVCVAPKLHLLGFGGSVPGYVAGEQIWAGFPYQSNEAMAEDLQKFLDPIFFTSTDQLEPGSSIVFMTHNGPRESSTTEGRIRGEVNLRAPLVPIISGSTALHELLCKDELQKHVIMNIHGHTHDAPGQAVIGGTTVLNPGALVEGRFGIYTLESSPEQSRTWDLVCVSFHKLPG